MNGVREAGATRLTAEVCVVGSGAGGMVAACLLARRGKSVVLLEEGRHFSPAEYTGYPLEMLPRLYRNASMTVAWGRPVIPIPMGKCVGGTTVINSGTCLRLRPETLEDYRLRYGWRIYPAELDECYGEVERILGVTVPSEDVVGENARLLRTGAERLGIKAGFLPRNSPSCEGQGVCCFGCPGGLKQSVDLSFLPLGVKHGLRLVPECRVIFFSRRWRNHFTVKGVRVSNGQMLGHLSVQADRVVVAAGAVHTTELLRRSGLGSLSSGLGGHLTIHPAVKMFARFPHEVKSWQGVPQSFYTDALVGDAVSIESVTIPPDIGAAALPMAGSRHRDLISSYSRLGCCGLMVHDHGCGEVRPLPFYREPLITYQVAPDDVARIQKGLALMTRIFLAAGAEEAYPGIPYASVMRNEADVARFEGLPLKAQDLEIFGFHPAGTCRMADLGHRGMVNEEMELRGAPGVFVSDASILPKPPGVNPQLTIMALAAWLAKRMK